MPERLTPIEIKLRKFSERLHRGWARLHPVTEQQLEVVRQAVRQQWAQEQRQAPRVAQKKTSRQTQADQPVIKPTEVQAQTPKVRVKAKAAIRRRPAQKQTPQQVHRLSP